MADWQVCPSNYLVYNSVTDCTGIKATCSQWEDKVISAEAANKKGKRKQTTLKQFTKKTQGSDSEEEFKPTKAKAKKLESKAVVKKAPQAGSAGSKVKLDDDDADDVKPPTAPAKTVVKKAVKDESDSDFEVGATKAAPLKKTAARKVTKKEEDDSDFEIVNGPTEKANIDNDSDIEVMLPPSKDKGKGKVSAAPKRKR